MSSDKEKKDNNEATAAKIAGAAVAVGIAWGIFRFVRAKKEEEALIKEYYGDREDFVVPDGDSYDSEEVFVEERSVFVEAEPPPPPPEEIVPPHSDELKSVSEEEIKATEKVEHESHKSQEKPWFLRLFDSPKKTNGKPASKESEIHDSRDWKPRESHTYEIKRGDTLWSISGNHGISLDALKSANGLYGDLIYAGDKLVIPPK